MLNQNGNPFPEEPLFPNFFPIQMPCKLLVGNLLRLVFTIKGKGERVFGALAWGEPDAPLTRIYKSLLFGCPPLPLSLKCKKVLDILYKLFIISYLYIYIFGKKIGKKIGKGKGKLL